MKHTFQVPSRKVSLKTDEYPGLLLKVLMLTGCQIVTHRRFIKDIQATTVQTLAYVCVVDKTRANSRSAFETAHSESEVHM